MKWYKQAQTGVGMSEPDLVAQEPLSPAATPVPESTTKRLPHHKNRVKPGAPKRSLFREDETKERAATPPKMKPSKKKNRLWRKVPFQG